MGTRKIKFLKEGGGKIGLNGQSYPFRRMNQNRFHVHYEMGHLGRTNLIQIFLFLYSIFDLFSEFRNGMDHMTELKFSFIRKLKDPVLEYIQESNGELDGDKFNTVIKISNSSERTQPVKGENSTTILDRKFLKVNLHVLRKEMMHEIYNQYYGSTNLLCDSVKTSSGLEIGHKRSVKRNDRGTHKLRQIL